jgi:hypothetical protein
MLFGRRVWIVELADSELERARDYARRLGARRTHDGSDTFRRTGEGEPSDEMKFGWDEQGAQGKLAVGRVLGVRAPLRLDGWETPDLPPNWHVKTQQSTSKDMLDGYLRLLRRALRPGWRHVLVERDVAMWGGFVFIVHGWIADDQVAEVGRRRYSYSPNQFVHLRHLQPLERELYDTVHGAPTDEPPAAAPFDTDPDAALDADALFAEDDRA